MSDENPTPTAFEVLKNLEWAGSESADVCPDCKWDKAEFSGQHATYCNLGKVISAPTTAAQGGETREALAWHLWARHFEGTEFEESWALGKETQAHFYGEADKILSLIHLQPGREEAK